MFWRWITFLGWDSTKRPYYQVEKRVLPTDQYKIKELPGKGYLLSLGDKDLIFKNKKSIVKYLYKRLKT